MTICLVATAHAETENQQQVTALFKTLQQHSQQEPGCIQYDLGVRPLENLCEFVVMEQWQSQEALDEHMTLAHFVDFQKATANLVFDVTMRVYQKLD